MTTETVMPNEETGAAGRPLRVVSWPVLSPGHRQVLLRVATCGVCRTDFVGGDRMCYFLLYVTK